MRPSIVASIALSALTSGCAAAVPPAVSAPQALPAARPVHARILSETKTVAFTPNRVTVNGTSPADTVLSYPSDYPPQLSNDCGTSSDPLAGLKRYKVKKKRDVTYSYEHAVGLNEYNHEDYRCEFKATILHEPSAILKITVKNSRD